MRMLIVSVIIATCTGKVPWQNLRNECGKPLESKNYYKCALAHFNKKKPYVFKLEMN